MSKPFDLKDHFGPEFTLEGTIELAKFGGLDEALKQALPEILKAVKNFRDQENMSIRKKYMEGFETCKDMFDPWYDVSTKSEKAVIFIKKNSAFLQVFYEPYNEIRTGNNKIKKLIVWFGKDYKTIEIVAGTYKVCLLPELEIRRCLNFYDNGKLMAAENRRGDNGLGKPLSDDDMRKYLIRSARLSRVSIVGKCVPLPLKSLVHGLETLYKKVSKNACIKVNKIPGQIFDKMIGI